MEYITTSHRLSSNDDSADRVPAVDLSRDGMGDIPPSRFSNNFGKKALNIVYANAIENHIAQTVKVFQNHSGARTNEILSK